MFFEQNRIEPELAVARLGAGCMLNVLGLEP
jgi:hypothetical protein